MEYRYEHLGITDICMRVFFECVYFSMVTNLDMVQLESQLKEASDARMKLIVSDGVFSMDGEIAPLK